MDSSIRDIRKSKGLTLTGLSELSGISVPQLSKFENDKGSLSVESLRKLASALEVPLSSLMMTQEVPSIRPVRAGEGFQMNRFVNNPDQVTERYLTIRRTARMQPMLLNLQPGVNSGRALSHAGDEFFYVLEGAVRFFYGDDTNFEMERGDFIYYDCGIPHRWENASDETPVSVLICNTPPVI